MIDQFGRTIDYLRISIIDRCNLRCRYCTPHEISYIPNDDLLSNDEILRIAKLATELDITNFKITGGEPLIRQNCVDLIGRLKSLPKVNQVTMTTNGVLLEHYLDKLVDAGLDAVNISIDTLLDDKYKYLTNYGNISTSYLISVAEKCIANGIKTKINTVLLKINQDEINSIASIASKMPIDVRFIELMPIGVGSLIEGINPNIALSSLKKQWPDLYPVNVKLGNGPAHYYSSQYLQGYIGFIDAVSHKFCEHCNRIRLTSNGYIKPCLCYDSSVDILSNLRTGVSDDILINILYKTIYEKPHFHCFSDNHKITEEKNMIQIGG